MDKTNIFAFSDKAKYQGYDENTQTNYYGVRTAFDVMNELDQAHAYADWAPGMEETSSEEPYIGKHRSGKVKFFGLFSKGRHRKPKHIGEEF